MAYQYKREPLTQEEASRLANACSTGEERLVVWTLLDTGLRVGELSTWMFCSKHSSEPSVKRSRQAARIQAR